MEPNTNNGGGSPRKRRFRKKKNKGPGGSPRPGNALQLHGADLDEGDHQPRDTTESDDDASISGAFVPRRSNEGTESEHRRPPDNKPPPPPFRGPRHGGDIFTFLQQLVSLLLNTITALLSLFTYLTWIIPAIPALLILTFVLTAAYICISSFVSNLNWLLSFTPFPFSLGRNRSTSLPFLTSLENALSSPSALVSTFAKVGTPLAFIYCSSIGIGCPEESRFDESTRRRNKEERLGKIARSANFQAVKTLDIFQSVVALTAQDGPASGLHRLELLELGAAVGFSSDLPDREFLGERLVTLGTQTGLLRDDMRRITAKSMSSFEWILHSFDRLERAVVKDSALPSDAPPSSLSPTNGNGKMRGEILYEELIDQITSEMSSLRLMLESAIHSADESTALGQQLMAHLWRTDEGVRRVDEERSVWEVLVEGRGHKGRKIKRDLELSRESILAVRDVRKGLDRARGSLIEYEANVENFQAGIVGFYASSQSMSIEEEIESLSAIIRMFRQTRDVARGRDKILSVAEIEAALEARTQGQGQGQGRLEEVD